jgi:hypothetical protein
MSTKNAFGYILGDFLHEHIWSPWRKLKGFFNGTKSILNQPHQSAHAQSSPMKDTVSVSTDSLQDIFYKHGLS